MEFSTPIDSIHDLKPQLSNLKAYWLGWGRFDDAPGGMSIYHTGLPHPLFNGVLQIRGISVDDALPHVRRRLAGLPHLWWVDEDSDLDVDEQILARGGRLESTLPVMAVDLKRVAEVHVPGLVIEQVVGRREISDYVAAYSSVFHIPGELLEAVVDAELGYSTAYSDVVRFVGRMDGRVVGTAQLSISHGVAGVYCVATREEYRGQGIASALTAAALMVGRQRGLRIGSLQSSGLGEPVYRRLGFETVGRLRHFAID
jgi:ribosomal protein S18 acetylase RimI-like enzyme